MEEPSSQVPRGGAGQLGWGARNRAPLIVGAVALLVFLPSVLCGFVFDDLSLISENQYAQDLRYLGRAFTTHLWDIYRTGATGDGRRYYRPIVAVSYLFNWAISGGTPWSFHLCNAACHALTTVLAARIAQRWTGHAALGVIAALVFALHPSRTESVSWISGRTDLLMALFMLAAVECAFFASRAVKRAAVVWGASAVAATVLAILSKENAIATGLLIAVDASLAARRPRRTLVGLALLTGGLGFSYLVARALFYPIVVGQQETHVTLEHGLMTCWAYVERVLLPWPQTFFYRTLIAEPGQRLVPIGLVVLGLSAALGYLGLLLFAWRRDRPAFWLLLGALVLFGPLLNFTDSGLGVTTSDRFLYLPLLPLSCGLLRLSRRRVVALLDHRTALLAGAGVLVVWVAIVEVRALDYANEDVFWQHEASVDPENPFVVDHLSTRAAQRGEIEAAYAMTKQNLSRQTWRYRVLSSVKARAWWYLRALSLHAVLSADGNVTTLNNVFRELDTFLRGEPGRMSGRVDDLELGAKMPSSTLEWLDGRESYGIAAECAMLATRVGADDRARDLLARIPDEQLWRTENPLNLILTRARLGDFEHARKNLAFVSDPPPGIKGFDAQTLEDLSARLRGAEQKLRDAETSPPDRARLLRAAAMGDLGAYLRGLRILRPLYDSNPDAPGVAPLYVQLLVAARLQGEALEHAKRHLGAERAAQAVAQIEAQLPERIRRMSAPEPSPWWPLR